MPILGKIQKLNVLRETSVGHFLGGEGKQDVLLPRKFTDEMKVGDEVEVFVYKDHENRIIATTLKPKVQVGEFACLYVKDDTSFGAFLDWGLEKDLLVPFDEQLKRLHKGDWCLVYVITDEKTGRLIGSTKLSKFVAKSTEGLEEGQSVEALIWEDSELGLKVIVDDKYEGLVFFSDLFQEVAQGDRVPAYISKIRPNGKLDIRLGLRGYQNIEPNADKIYRMLEKENGFMPFNDKSDPDAIVDAFQMSKKLFKKAIGVLYKKREIEITEEGIRIANKKPE